MSEKIYVGRRVSSLDTGKAPANVSRVNLTVNSDVFYTAGDDSGRSIEVTCPWGTQAMADGILAKLRRHKYQPYSAEGAILDPAAEIGDSVTVGNIYSVISGIGTEFDSLCAARINAPESDEIDDEYPYEGTGIRGLERKISYTRSLITKTASEIRLEVENTEKSLRAAIKINADQIESSVKSNKEYTDNAVGSLEGSFNVKLESYSTITQTDTKITSAVSTSKTYTDTQTGKITASLNNYSTITQTDSKIEASVNSSKSYTDTQTGKITESLKNYSTITQTDTKISSAVNETKQYVDGSYSDLSTELTQTAAGFTAQINGLDGQYTTLKATVDGLTVTDASGTTRIKGGSVETDTLKVKAANVSGTMTGVRFETNGTQTRGKIIIDNNGISMGSGTIYDDKLGTTTIFNSAIILQTDGGEGIKLYMANGRYFQFAAGALTYRESNGTIISQATFTAV